MIDPDPIRWRLLRLARACLDFIMVGRLEERTELDAALLDTINALWADGDNQLDTTDIQVVDHWLDSIGERQRAALADTAPDLIRRLHVLANEYGALGVALVAARMSSPEVVARRLTRDLLADNPAPGDGAGADC